MNRPCFLVLDPEHAGSISTRKLVIETSKFEVITAYSSAEAKSMLARFPELDGAVIDARASDMPLPDLIRALREIKQGIPVVVIASPGPTPPPEADYIVDSLEPAMLLEVLRNICPGETEAILKRDRELEADGR